VIFFHGAKTRIDGKVDSSRSRINNDFGKGFYCCESLEQSAMFVSNFPDSSLYAVDFNKEGLKSKSFDVNREWMSSESLLTKQIAAHLYFCGGLCIPTQLPEWIMVDF